MTIFRAFIAAAGAALSLAGAAHGAYPGTYGEQGVLGSLTVSGSGGTTTLSAGGRTVTIKGAFGIPTLITTGARLGLSHDRSRVVLQSVSQGPTRFVVVRMRDLHVLQTLTLNGSYAFDALSPDSARLYLIEHRSTDLQHYIVRAYDLRARRLLPGRIADRTQASWVMHGWPASRVATTDGRWVYTLYANPGGYPFVHALDTVMGVAHCVGIGWQGSQDPLYNYRLVVRGSRLLVLRANASVYRAIDRTTWAVSLR